MSFQSLNFRHHNLELTFCCLYKHTFLLAHNSLIQQRVFILLIKRCLNNCLDCILRIFLFRYFQTLETAWPKKFPVSISIGQGKEEAITFFFFFLPSEHLLHHLPILQVPLHKIKCRIKDSKKQVLQGKAAARAEARQSRTEVVGVIQLVGQGSSCF